ncbi:hypothetical protein [Bacillus sp. FJAT-27445]|uniref:hypothetical protein n=1 Tax=Bacillus sp. FJAT-27445 TaxID=1679166 RepID=UPI0007444FC5|nr:hypothetical protein [Bacillus sp. FJAT-27445]
MKLFTVIEAGFLMANLLIFYYFIEPILAVTSLLKYVIPGIYLALSLIFLIWIKKKVEWLNRNINADLGVMLILAIILGPFFIELFLFGIGR